MSNRSSMRYGASSSSGEFVARNALLQRSCACGQHTLGGSTCDQCRSQESSLANRRPPGKAVGVKANDHGEVKRSPRQGDATIQCNGAGGWEIVYGNYAGATCGTKNCVTAHESSHMEDWKAKWPNGCTGKARGYLPKGDPPDNPLMSVSEYESFLKDSECKAHTADLQCAEALPKIGACKTTVEDYIKLTKEQKANYCTGLPTWAKVLIGIGAAGLAGGIAAAIIAHH